MKKNVKGLILTVLISMVMVLIGCNNGIGNNYNGTSKGSADRSSRGSIDTEEYIDFTSPRYNANLWKKEDLLKTMGTRTFRNGNSTIKFNAMEGSVEISSDKGFYNGKSNCQLYAKYTLETVAASSDCLYIRRNPRYDATLIVNNNTLRGGEISDLTLCIPLYGYSKNRVEVSSVMNGYIGIPSGTYWNR